MATGIGSWSEDDIVRALRMGMRPDGTPILPPMPWPKYARMHDDDARAIARFLKAQPAVTHQVPADQPPGEAPLGKVIGIPAPEGWDAPAAAPSGGG